MRAFTDGGGAKSGDRCSILDAGVVDLCAQCLAAAAAEDSGQDSLALSATALARDLADTHGAAAPALLTMASRHASRYLDDSDLDARSFAAAHRRLVNLRSDVDAKLRVTVACASS
jgi:hypothetical protein